MRSFFVVCALLLSVSATAVHADIRIATWNLGNLHAKPDEPLREGAPARNADDIRRLNKIRETVDADVFALQEVNGPVAARLIFPALEYELCVSSRYIADMQRGWYTPRVPGWDERRTDRIYTIIAVRRGPFQLIECQYYPHISVFDYDEEGVAREVRRGVSVRLFWDDNELTLLNVHLKSGCPGKAIAPVDGEHRDPDCRTHERHVNALEAWTDAHIRQGRAIAIVGDFNRRLNAHHGGAPTKRGDHLWQDLNDDKPRGAQFIALPEKTNAHPPDRRCWAHQKDGTGYYQPQPIDFLMFDARAARLVRAGTFREWDLKTTLGEDFDTGRYSGRDGDRLSDHCPVSADLK
jgi:endonuclease/exonuclease/phosphatase family metal-dependent hydrolase